MGKWMDRSKEYFTLIALWIVYDSMKQEQVVVFFE
jgi:hypothetical protein